jgi:ArsR family transcriptional regulator
VKNQHIQSLSQLFRVLSDQTRLKLVVTLKDEGEQHVSWLCRKLHLPQPTVSHHLGLLRTHGLVRNRRAGKQVFYSIDPSRFNRIASLANGLFVAV